MVNQDLEKAVSLMSADFYGSQRVKHLPGSVSNLVSLVQADAILPFLQLDALLPLWERKYFPPSAAKGKEQAAV